MKASPNLNTCSDLNVYNLNRKTEKKTKHQKEKVAYKTGQSNLTFKVNPRDSQNHDNNAN